MVLTMFDEGNNTAQALSEWVGKARGGDSDAYCELVRAHQANLRAYLARFIQDSEQVLDLAQDAFLIAWRRLDTFDASREFFPWLRGIARTRALEYLRKTGRRERREEAAMADWLALWSAERLEQDAPGELAYVPELKRCLSKLAGASARALQLRYFQQLSISEVASALERTEGTVKMMLLRVRQALRKCIESERAADGAVAGALK